MATAALKKNQGFYDVVPIDRRYTKPHTHHPFEVFRKFGQGAGAAYLMMTGSGSLIGAGAERIVDFTSLEGLARSLATGGVTGPLQILGAIVIFLMAGRCVARFLGLLTVGAAFVLYSQGVTLAEIASFAGEFGARFSAATDAFLATPAHLSAGR